MLFRSMMMLLTASFSFVARNQGSGALEILAASPNLGIVISQNGNVGIGTTAPSTKLEVAGTVSASALVVNGVVVTKYNSVTSGLTLDNTYNIILADATSGAFTINLPAVASSAGFRYVFKKTDATINTVTIDADGSENIDNKLSHSLNMQYEYLDIMCNGTRWFILGNN